ncbi:hypothetical protein K438DRAFT_1947466 [Mycena galopus ATCC 62051]|nr:hypothetical protein K438DRAFT_1947466 [Mycena galopus ATCC 62051]
MIARARTVLTPFSLDSVSEFLEAPLGMESGSMRETSMLRGCWQTGADAKIINLNLNTSGNDEGVLLGITHALSESYMGFQCMYALNAAHSKFTELYETVFPARIEGYRTPVPSRKVNLAVSNITSAASSSSSLSVVSSRNAAFLNGSTIVNSSPAFSVASTPTPVEFSAGMPPPLSRGGGTRKDEEGEAIEG